MPFEFAEDNQRAQLKVIGVGGAGGNAVGRMIEAEVAGVEFVATNTDAQVLSLSSAPHKIQLGATLTRGRGAGALPEIGRKAAEEDRDAIAETLQGIEMLFITAGMGGGTGTGASPVIARLAKEMDILTVAIVTKPFAFEGKTRMRNADQGILQLREFVDTLIVIPNQKLLTIVNKNTSLTEAFRMADEVLMNATRGISDLVVVPGLINLDFADVRTVMQAKGDAIMGTGVGSGDNRAIEAAQRAISSPLLEDIPLTGAQGVLVNFTGGEDMGLIEVNEAASLIQEAAGEEANVIFGAVIDPAIENGVRVTVIATGLNREEELEQETKSASFGGFRQGPQRQEVLDRPTFKRILKPSPEEFNETKEDIPTQEDLEIPTYLRRRMD